MKLLLITIAILLSNCADNVTNVTQITQSGGAFISQGTIKRQPATSTYTISLSDINPSIHILNSTIDFYSINFWSRDTTYGFDTLYTGTHRIRSVEVIGDSIALSIQEAKSAQVFYKLLCWHK